MYTVYQHKNKVNGKSYFGITSRKPEVRWGHNGVNYKTTPYFYSAIKKYGWDNFEHIIIYENLTKEEACLMEQVLIKDNKSNTREYGYNHTTGGECGFVMSDEARKKLSAAMTGNKNNYGNHLSEETKEKIRQSNIGKKRTDEERKKMSESAKKRHVPCSEEKKKKLSQSYPNKKRVYWEEQDIIFDSVQECSRKTGISAAEVSHICSGKRKPINGFHLFYYNDMINA